MHWMYITCIQVINSIQISVTSCQTNNLVLAVFVTSAGANTNIELLWPTSLHNCSIRINLISLFYSPSHVLLSHGARVFYMVNCLTFCVKNALCVIHHFLRSKMKTAFSLPHLSSLIKLFTSSTCTTNLLNISSSKNTILWYSSFGKLFMEV